MEIVMQLKKIIAIIRSSRLEEVERRLQALGVNGLSVSCVKGYGEYKNFFCRDLMITHARIEIFSYSSSVEEIVQAIMEAGHSGSPGDGIIAILPVERIYRIRTKSEALPEEV
jgi:nitrogen regulatory protein P-II 1